MAFGEHDDIIKGVIALDTGRLTHPPQYGLITPAFPIRIISTLEKLNMTQSFAKGGVAIITGGASGIDLMMANKCHGRGMHVIVADKDVEHVAAAKQKLGDDVTAMELDVSNPEDWKSLKTTVEEDFGGGFSCFLD